MRRTTPLAAILLFFLSQGMLIAQNPYFHKETGIILPTEIEGLRTGKKTVFEQEGLGESIPYNSQHATATIYIYQNRKNLHDNPEHVETREELANAIKQIEDVGKLGIYDNVQYGDSGKLSGKEGKFSFLATPVSYDVVQDPDTRKPITPITNESFIGVGIYKGHFIKLRHSLKQGGDRQKSLKERDDFVQAFVSLILEVELRPIVKELIQIYLKAPLSPKGREALGGIVAYAQKSRLVAITIDADVTPWSSVDGYPYAPELLGAYIVGQVHAQLSNKKFKSDKTAGMRQLLKVYKRLKAKDKKAIVKELDNHLKKTQR